MVGAEADTNRVSDYAGESGRLRDPIIAQRVRSICHTEPEETCLRIESLAHLLRTYAYVQDQLSVALAPYGLSPAKLNVLILLKAAGEGGLPMSHIGHKMAVTCANVTKLIDGLEAARLVERHPSEDDKRSVFARLTAEGDHLLATALPAHAAAVREIWSDTSTDECLSLIYLMMKLRGEASGPGGEPRRLSRDAERRG
jgi:MarR family 2-MHQ and catechol resistance regulon transcriptional repressor